MILPVLKQSPSSLTLIASISPSCPYAELEKMLAEKRIAEMTDEDIIGLTLKGKVPGHSVWREH